MNAAEDPDELVGKTLLGKLKVKRLLGEGGMGAVYEVTHLLTKHDRALKVLHRNLLDSETTVERFLREAGVAGTLRSKHVAETYDVGRLEDGSVYVLMELLHGQTLADLLEEERLEPGRLVGLVCQACEGIHEAHAAGIVHRDLKPDNLFVVRDEDEHERLKILDFGISKFSGATVDGASTLTREGTVLGTPYYMSPEQAVGKRDLDARTDVYALGVILYEGLTGRRPYEGESLPKLVIEIHGGKHPPLASLAPHVDAELAAIVERAMHVDEAARFESAEALLRALLPFASARHAVALSTLPGSVAPRERRSDPRELSLAATVDARPAPSAHGDDDDDDDEVADGRSPSSRPRWLWAALALLVMGGLGAAWSWAGPGDRPDDASAQDGAAMVSPSDEARELEPPAPAPEADDDAVETDVAEVDEVTEEAAPTVPAEEPVRPTARGRRPDPERSGERWQVDRDNPYP